LEKALEEFVVATLETWIREESFEKGLNCRCLKKILIWTLVFSLHAVQNPCKEENKIEVAH
jgi:hypothetical protein